MNLSKLKKTRIGGHGLYLIFILLLGAFLRLYQLGNLPYGFFCDEASIGYNAFLISRTLHDEFGEFLPLFFQSFGEFKGSLPIYVASPFVYFNLSEVTTRLPFALSGIGIIFLMYLIGKEYKGRTFGLVAAFFTAITPWFIHYSRIAFELNFYLLFLLIVVYLFKRSEKNSFFITAAFTTAGVSLYTYRASFLQIPLLLIVFGIIYRKILLKNINLSLLGISAFVILSIPVVLHVLGGDGLVRYQHISILSSQNLTLFEKIFEITDTYFYHFSPNFLFTKGDDFAVTRHFIAGFPPLLITLLPLLLLGGVKLFSNYKSSFTLLIIMWFIIYPLSGSLTIEPPYTSRSIMGAPAFIFVISFGATTVLNMLYKMSHARYLLLFFAGAIWINSLWFNYYYFTTYPKVSSDFWGWQYGPKEILSYFDEHKDKYDEMYMIPEFNAPEIFIKFYVPECSNCRIGTPDVNFDPSKKQLFAVSDSYITAHPFQRLSVHKTIYYPDGSIAFRIGEVVQ